MRRFPWPLVFTVLFITGCTNMCRNSRSSMSPEQVVEAYLDKALNMKDVSDRDQLVEYTTGPLKAVIESASPETIRAAYVDRAFKLERYSVIERLDRTPRETEITFQLTYQDVTPASSDPKVAPTVTTENTVALAKESGLWLIKDVVGNKTAIDFPISEASRITAKPGQVTPPEEPDLLDDDQGEME